MPRKPVLRLVHTSGLPQISAVLEGLPKAMRTKILAAAVGAAAKILVTSAKRYARRSEDTGRLRDSITHVVRRYEHDARAVAITGPIVEKGARALRRSAGNGTKPAVKYAHLIEFGHHIVTGGSGRDRQRRRGNSGRSNGWVPAKPFMRPAFAVSQQAMQKALAEGIAAGIKTERASLMRSGAHAA